MQKGLTFQSAPDDKYRYRLESFVFVYCTSVALIVSDTVSEYHCILSSILYSIECILVTEYKCLGSPWSVLTSYVLFPTASTATALAGSASIVTGYVPEA